MKGSKGTVGLAPLPKGAVEVAGGVTAARGFLASGTAAGVKSEAGKTDLMVLLADRPAAWGATFTTNRMAAAPVALGRELLAAGGRLQAVVVNSGNANAATGAEGKRRARQVTAAAARVLEMPPGRVLVSSTGIIGRQLPAGKIVAAIPAAVAALAPDGGPAAAAAIMTTDTFPKSFALEARIGGGVVRVGGMTKGAGMIHPRMATMLAYLTTDAKVAQPVLRRILRGAVERTFNRVSIDGDRSTNDTALLMAGGASGVAIPAHGVAHERFAALVTTVCARLARMIVLDGEGMTKLVEITVTGAASDAEALRAADAIANSPLVKTAWYGQDLNWGRMVAAAGYAEVRLDPARISVTLNGLPVVRRGRGVEGKSFARAAAEMKKKELAFTVGLGVGKGSDRILTCDLTDTYVRINADYPT